MTASDLAPADASRVARPEIVPIHGRVLLTGAAGFVGAAVRQAYRRAGAEVHAVSRMGRRSGGVEWHRCELEHAQSVRKLVEKVEPEAILHLSSLVHGAPHRELVEPTLRANLLATVHLLDAAVETVPDAPFVVTGTNMEPQHGDPADQVAASPYAMAKSAATGYVRMYRRLYGLPTVPVRLHMVYGPGQREARKLLAHVGLSVLRGEVPRLSSGRWETDWIYLDDVAEAVVAAANAAVDVDGSPVDVGSGQTATVRDVAQMLATTLDPSTELDFGALPDRPAEDIRVADPATWRGIGWAPRTDLGDGIDRTARWLRAEHERGAPWTSAEAA